MRARQTCMVIFCWLAPLWLGASIGWSAVYYMPDLGQDLQTCFSRMSGGDTLIVRDGVYTGAANKISAANQPRSGTADAYTVIRAEHPGQVQFDGQNVRSMLHHDYGMAMNFSYVEFRGLEWINGLYGTSVSGAAANNRTVHHVKFMECGSEDSFDASYAAYILFEDCYAWGKGRYNFIPFTCDHVIFRRCVARLDAADGWSGSLAMPISNYVNYTSQFVEFQNCIAIDSDDDFYSRFEGIYGGFYLRKPNDIGGTIYRSENTALRGCLTLNVKHKRSGTSSGGQTLVLDYDLPNSILENCVFWDLHKGGITSSQLDEDYFVRHCVFGRTVDSDMIHAYWTPTIGNVSDSIFNQIQGTALVDVHASTRNAFYANAEDKSGVTVSSGDIQTVDPLGAGGLKYLPRIETSGIFHAAATDGGDIGATIIRRIGVSGTLYGEAGYAALTAESLWPWPIEARIKHAFRTYGIQASPDPKRGFCADGNGLYGGPVTLTSYIWEYLGQALPTGIYGSDTEAPNAPGGVKVK